MPISPGWGQLWPPRSMSSLWWVCCSVHIITREVCKSSLPDGCCTGGSDWPDIGSGKQQMWLIFSFLYDQFQYTLFRRDLMFGNWKVSDLFLVVLFLPKYEISGPDSVVPIHNQIDKMGKVFKKEELITCNLSQRYGIDQSKTYYWIGKSGFCLKSKSVWILLF